MKKIFESEFNGFDDGESVTKVHVYELDNVDEFWKFEHMNFDKKCNLRQRTLCANCTII